MSPPPAFALFLLGCWALMIFAVTNQAGYDQLRAARRSESVDDGDDQSDGGDARWTDATSSGVTSLSDD